MDKKFIKVLIEEGRPLRDIPEVEALTKLNNDVMTVYVMNGLHRQMQPDAFKEEVRTCAVALYQELVTDPVYKSIRDKEIPYIFSNGMKGRLGTDKDIVLTYKSLIRWVEGYIKHQERREAVGQYVEDHREKPKQLPAYEMTEDDYKRMTSDAWSEFCEYKDALAERFEAIKKGAINPRKNEPVSIGEVIGTPFCCYDYGKMRITYLRQKGYAKEGDSLLDVFERAYGNGKRFVKVSEDASHSQA